MAKDDQKKSKQQAPPAKGRSFSCSMFIYTLVFVSGVVVATILPDLAGHHFKQPYGKEYGQMAEQALQDLPKYLKRFSETAMLVTGELGNRVWDLKLDLQRRWTDMNKKTDEKKTTSRSKTHSHSTNKRSSHDEDI